MPHVTVDGPRSDGPTIHGNESERQAQMAKSLENLQTLTTGDGTLPEPRRGGRQNWPLCAALPGEFDINRLQIFGDPTWAEVSTQPRLGRQRRKPR